MMRPDFCWRISAVAGRNTLNRPFRCTAMTGSHSSSVMLKIMRSRSTPAACTTMSSLPNVATACSTIARPAANSATESPLIAPFAPSASTSASTCCAGPLSRPSPPRLAPRSLIRTLAPQPASDSTIPRPMPRPPPVTSAVFPSSRAMSSPLRQPERSDVEENGKEYTSQTTIWAHLALALRAIQRLRRLTAQLNR